MSSRIIKFSLALLMLAPLCVPGTAQAGTITGKQVAADLATVDTDIAHNPMGYRKSIVAQTDLNAGIAAMIAGDVAAALGNNKGAQAEFAIAVTDFNAVLKVLGDAPPGGDPPGVPEPASMLLVGIGMIVLAGARGMKNYQERRQTAEAVHAA